MKHIITIKITTKEKIAKVIHEIELTCNELVERDEDLYIEHEKAEHKDIKKQSR